MTQAIVFPFAIGERALAAADAQYRVVLARQVARAVVTALNGDQDRGMRFFPFLGVHEGRRRFFELTSALPFATLSSVHGQKGARHLIDGVLDDGTIHTRVHDAHDGMELLGIDVPFSTGDPYAAVRRIVFEVAPVIGVDVAPPAGPLAEGKALECLLTARDDLLALEANLLRPDGASFFSAIEQGITLVPQDAEMRELCLDIARRLAEAGLVRDRIARCLHALVSGALRADAEFAAKAVVIVEACDRALATACHEAIALERPAEVVSVVRAVRGRVARGELEAARSLLDKAEAAGVTDVRLAAERAVVAERQGDLAERDRNLELLVPIGPLPLHALKSLVGHLMRTRRFDAAATRIDQALKADAKDASLWLDRARLGLVTGDAGASRMALQRCMALKLAPALRAEAERLLRFASEPEVWLGLRAVEAALDGGDPRSALALAKKLVARRPGLGEGWLMLGIARHKLGHRLRARRALERALALDGGLGEAHHRLGMLYLERGRGELAYEYLAHAVLLLDFEPTPQLHFAQACALVGRSEEGRRALTKAGRLGAAKKLVEQVRATFFAA